MGGPPLKKTHNRNGNCAVEGCGKPIRSRGFCEAHYRSLRKYGDPLTASIGGARICGARIGQARTFFENEVLPYKGDDCLVWPFTRATSGYAQLWREGRNVYVTRLICEAIYGPPPTDKHHAAHSCGKGHEGCVNPQHLRWATPRDNHADRITHGTNGRKLADADVLAIRKASGTHREIAAKFGVSNGTIGLIKSYKTWRHLKEG